MVNDTHSANNSPTSPTTIDHIPGAISKLPSSRANGSSLYEIPIRRSRTVSKRMFRIQLDIFVLAM